MSVRDSLNQILTHAESGQTWAFDNELQLHLVQKFLGILVVLITSKRERGRTLLVAMSQTTSNSLGALVFADASGYFVIMTRPIINASDETDVSEITISPDGRLFVFGASKPLMELFAELGWRDARCDSPNLRSRETAETVESTKALESNDNG